MAATPAPATKKVNLRTPEVMEAVQAQVEKHYRSHAVEFVRATGQPLVAKDMTVVLAKAFGFCYGVERAIDLAYAAAKVGIQVYLKDLSLEAAEKGKAQIAKLRKQIEKAGGKVEIIAPREPYRKPEREKKA